MMQTDWKKELGDSVSMETRIAIRFGVPAVHVPSEQLDLQRDHCLADPDDGKHTREDKLLLLIFGASRKEETEEQAEQQRAPANC